MGQRRNYTDYSKILWDEWKQKKGFKNFGDVVKIVLTGKFIAVSAYSERRPQINN